MRPGGREGRPPERLELAVFTASAAPTPTCDHRVWDPSGPFAHWGPEAHFRVKRAPQRPPEDAVAADEDVPRIKTREPPMRQPGAVEEIGYGLHPGKVFDLCFRSQWGPLEGPKAPLDEKLARDQLTSVVSDLFGDDLGRQTAPRERRAHDAVDGQASRGLPGDSRLFEPLGCERRVGRSAEPTFNVELAGSVPHVEERFHSAISVPTEESRAKGG